MPRITLSLFMTLALLAAVPGCSDPEGAALPDGAAAPDAADLGAGDLAASDLAASDLGAGFKDFLTPAYYAAAPGASPRKEIDALLAAARKTPLHHPLKDKAGTIPSHKVPTMGRFGASKGPAAAAQHHPAMDMHVGNKQSAVTLYAAHDGVVSTVRNAPKYRHYVAITSTLKDSGGKALGKLVTLYAHVDLDLDEAAGLKLDGKTVRAGDMISKNLYASTVGGPHLHLEVRLYRPADSGSETFYGNKKGNPALTSPSAGGWTLGHWDPAVGYGFADPRNHGVNLP